MKNMITLFLIAFALMSSALAVDTQQGVAIATNIGIDVEGVNVDLAQNIGAGGDLTNVSQKITVKADGQDITIDMAAMTKAGGVEEVKAMLQVKTQEMEQDMSGEGEKEQKVLMNQNTVRLAVHAMLAMEELTGSIGKDISAIAKEFNNSVQSTINAEAKIEKRSAMAKFFAGGDEKAAAEIEAEVAQNQDRIKELKQLKESCECPKDVKEMLQQQISSMEQEQTRLSAVALEQRSKKGIFGWVWK